MSESVQKSAHISHKSHHTIFTIMIATNNSSRPTSVKPFAKADYKHEDNTVDKSPLINNEQMALSQLKEKLANVPHDEKISLVYAQQVDKNLVTDDHLLGFIHVENFNIDVSVVNVVPIAMVYVCVLCKGIVCLVMILFLIYMTLL